MAAEMKEQGVNALIHAKHLYHDREEIHGACPAGVGAHITRIGLSDEKSRNDCGDFFYQFTFGRKEISMVFIRIFLVQ